MWKKAEKVLSKDKYLGPLIEKYGHCRVLPSRKEDYFTDLVEAIIGQQLSGKAATAIFRRLKEGLAGEMNPQVIIKSDEKELRSYGLSYAKIKYLKDLSHNVDRGDVNIERLAFLSNEKIIEELTKVKGIGRWTSEMFLIFSLGRPDIFPVDDLGIRNGIRKLLGVNMDPAKIVKFANRWKPFRSVAAWYVWRSLENK
jgi:DNA-3-methyladenine glycosylase II